MTFPQAKDNYTHLQLSNSDEIGKRKQLTKCNAFHREKKESDWKLLCCFKHANIKLS